MKNIIPLLLIAILFFYTCKENEPTAPEVETPTGDLMAEANIGPEGGMLETEDFRLIVPNGSFSESSKLELFLVDKESSNENSVSDIFLIDGIPEDYSLPLEIYVKYSGALSGLNFIEQKMESEIDYIDSTIVDTAFTLLEATEENGYLKAIIPALTGTINTTKFSKANMLYFSWMMEAYTNCASISSEHFTIKSIYFSENEYGQQLQRILQYFESAYNRFNTLKFDLSLTKWPKIILIEKHSKDDLIYQYEFDMDGNILLKAKNGSSLLKNMKKSDATLIAIILRSYWLSEKDRWINDSISIWSTFIHNYWEEYSDLKNMKENLNSTFLRALPGVSQTAITFEHLAMKYGQEIISSIVLEIKNGKEPIEAIISNSGPPKEWLAELHQYILSSETWLNRIKHHQNKTSMVDICKENWSAEFGIEDTTTVIKWTETYKDLSAKLYRVNLLPGLVEESGLKFTVDGGDAEISLFKYKGSEIEFITSSEKSDSVSNIKNLADNGYQLIALVSNQMPNYPNFSTSNIELKIEHKNVKPLPKITSCAITLLDIDVNIRKYWDDGTYSDDVYERFWTFFYPEGEPAPEPTFENNIYSQAYTFTDNQGYNVMGNMSVEFNKDLDTILTFSANYNIDKTVINPLYGTLEESISGQNIPLIPSYDNDEYTVTGLEVCEVLNDLKHSQTGGGSVEYDIISIKECRPDSDQWPSRLTIKITKE